MKNIKHSLLIIIILVMTLNLSSCLNVVRDIRVYSDGSGKEILTIDFGSDFMKMIVALVEASDSTKKQGFLDSLYNDELFIQETKEKYSNIPGVTLLDIFSQTNPDSSKTMNITYIFDDINLIGSSFNIGEKDLQKGKTEITYEEQGDKVYFKYFYQPQKDGEGIDEEDSTGTNFKESFAKIFEDDKLEFHFEFDYDVVSSNATHTDGRRLSWEFYLSDVYTINEPLVLEAVLQK